jgi:hypothetical protein
MREAATRELFSAGRRPFNATVREAIRVLRAMLKADATVSMVAAFEAQPCGTLETWFHAVNHATGAAKAKAGGRDLSRWIRPDNRALLATLADEMRPVLERKEAERRELLAREEAERQARYAREREERAVREAGARAAWLEGTGPRPYGVSWRDAAGGALLRAVGVQRDESGRITGGTLETSWGAEVPLTHAVRAFAFLRLCHETGRTWSANGKALPVGHFRIENVTPDGFKAGCHLISWGEVQRLAAALGLFESVQPADSALVSSAQLESA